jgi:hypothetical protein
MQTVKKATLKKHFWRGMQNSTVYAYYPAGTEVQVYKAKGYRSYSVVLPANEFDEVGGSWKGETAGLKFFK